MKKGKVIYSGFYGFKNTGDDAFLEVAAWATKNLMKDKTPVFFGNNLPELTNVYREYSKPFFKGHDRLIAAKELRNAECFISAGGSTFSRHKKNSYKELAEYIKRYYNKRLRTGAIGVSIGPFKTIDDEKTVQEYLKKLDFLAVRDYRSFEYVNSLNLPYKPIEAFDLAALLPEVYQTKFDDSIKRNKQVIGVSVCPVESISDKVNIKKEEERTERISRLLKEIEESCQNNIVFRFFIINGHVNIGDEEMTHKVIRQSGVKSFEIIPYQNSVFKSWKLIQECNFMIATRLHAGIMAAYADVPFVLNEYHQKCTDFVKDIGQHSDFIVGDADYEYNNLVLNINKVINGERKYNLENLAHTKNKAKFNFDFI